MTPRRGRESGGEKKGGKCRILEFDKGVEAGYWPLTIPFFFSLEVQNFGLHTVRRAVTARVERVDTILTRNRFTCRISSKSGTVCAGDAATRGLTLDDRDFDVRQGTLCKYICTRVARFYFVFSPRLSFYFGETTPNVERQ